MYNEEKTDKAFEQEKALADRYDNSYNEDTYSHWDELMKKEQEHHNKKPIEFPDEFWTE